MHKKNKGKPKVEVTLTRSFVFPNSVLENKNHAIDLAKQEFNEEVSAYGKNQVNGQITDTMEIDVEDKYSFGFKENVDISKENIELRKSVNALALMEMGKRYNSPFEPENNKELFVFEEAILSSDGQTVLHESEWYLHPKIEKEFNQVKKDFERILLIAHNKY